MPFSPSASRTFAAHADDRSRDYCGGPANASKPEITSTLAT
jgi:hypothetical protein